jgi:uncharacterized protein with von Willebrand factor type A (vWA) domain
VRERLLEFVDRLRARGVAVSVAETLDAAAAVAAAGVEREVLREALAATLVKDEGERPGFDALFDEMFPLVGAEGGGRRRRRRTAGGEDGDGGPRGGPGPGAGRGREREPAEVPAPASRPGERRLRVEAGPVARSEARRRAARTRELLALPFAEFTARDVAEARDLVRELGRRLRGRLARRERRTRRGRLDFRRTIRRAVSSGGVPVRPEYRGRRPGRPDLLTLVDLSGSVAAASELLLGLVAPAAPYFRRVEQFAFVDRLCPVSIEAGHVAPGGPLDLYARSDYGRVLQELWARHQALLGRGTLVLVLGDARTNRLPPRPEILRAIRDRVRAVVWLVPEPRARWNTGDSVLGLYAPSCDAVLECLDLAHLVAAVRRVL